MNFLVLTTDIVPVGTRITCTAGHYICRVAQTLKRYGEQRDGDFDDWQIPEPKTGNFIPKCKCGADFYLAGTGKKIHIENWGWWPGPKQVAPGTYQPTGKAIET
jgi:hypothetical protein